MALIGATNGQSLVLLHDGTIVAESYWRGADDTTTRDVASVQKSVTSTLVGLAIDRELLAFDTAVSDILGAGWSGASRAREAEITVGHLLTMTSGLRPRTLTMAHPPGTVWTYNTEAYQRLLPVLETVAGTGLEDLTRQWLFDPIGISPQSTWTDRGFVDLLGQPSRGLQLTARDMARFGLLASRTGEWAGERVVPERWFEDAWTPLPVKADYGRLWWLLGRGTLRRLGAPPDTVAALGKADQKIYVIPSAQLVLVRQGEVARDSTLTTSRFDRTLMQSVVAIIAG